MKYIKTYEDTFEVDEEKYVFPKYKKGDYILIDFEDIEKSYPRSSYPTLITPYKNYGIIMENPPTDSKFIMYDTYVIDSITNQFSEIEQCYVLERQIIRKLKPKEKKEFEQLRTFII
jgi:hypothetical protein